MYKKLWSCSAFWIKAQNPPLHCNPFPILTALIWSSLLHLCPSVYLIHISSKHVVSPDKREKRRTSGLKEKIRGREKEGAWLYSLITTPDLYGFWWGTALPRQLHCIPLKQEQKDAPLPLSSSCPAAFHSYLAILTLSFHFILSFPFQLTWLTGMWST